jgi:hypothetical protein
MLGVKGSQPISLTTSLPYVSQFSKKIMGVLMFEDLAGLQGLLQE